MKRSLIVFLLVSFLAAVIAFVGEADAGAAQVKKMRLSTNLVNTTPSSKGYELFAKRVNELTNGSVKIDIFYSAVLGSEREMMEQVKAGAIEMNHTAAAWLSAFVPVVDVLNVPYLYRSHDHYWKVLDGPVGNELVGEIDKSVVKWLFWVEAGSRSFYNNVKPITKPEDLRGLKIRVMTSEVMIKAMKAFGANPVATAWAEVYNALQTGVIDGAENSAISLYTSKQHEVVKYFSLNEHMKIPDMVLINGNVFKNLSDKEKAAFKQAAKEAQDFIKAEWNRQEDIAYKKIRETTAINEVPDKTAFINAVTPLHQELAPKFGGFLEKIKAVK